MYIGLTLCSQARKLLMRTQQLTIAHEHLTTTFDFTKLSAAYRSINESTAYARVPTCSSTTRLHLTGVSSGIYTLVKQLSHPRPGTDTAAPKAHFNCISASYDQVLESCQWE